MKSITPVSYRLHGNSTTRIFISLFTLTFTPVFISCFYAAFCGTNVRRGARQSIPSSNIDNCAGVNAIAPSLANGQTISIDPIDHRRMRNRNPRLFATRNQVANRLLIVNRSAPRITLEHQTLNHQTLINRLLHLNSHVMSTSNKVDTRIQELLYFYKAVILKRLPSGLNC
jgi:hypothetical protein